MKKTTIALLPLFFILFMDTLGTALIIPLLNPLFINANSTTNILPLISGAAYRNFFYGLTIGIYSICALFGAPILGGLSDMIGRKKVLTVCLLGAFCGYVMFAIAISTKILSLLILGRCVAGFTAGSLATAQASVIDLSTEKTKVTNIGLILLAVSLGYIAGPLVAGIFSNPQLYIKFNTATPLYIAAILSVLNVLLLLLFFHPAYKPPERAKIELLTGLHVFIEAFKDSKLRTLSIVFLLLQLGWSTYFQFSALYFVHKYNFSTTEVSAFMACLGIGFTIAFCYLLDILNARFSLKTIASASMSLMACTILLILVTNNPIIAYLLSIPSAMCLALSFSVLTVLFSNLVDNTQQGKIMGLTTAIGAFSFGVSGLCAGVIADFGASIPIWFAFICLFIGAVIITLKATDSITSVH